ncbi:polysaccharide lyase family 14 protein, partial [Postia placenta MAD-698-R-SB12]
MFESLAWTGLLAFAAVCGAATTASPSAIAHNYSLTTSTHLPFPTASLSNSDTKSYLTSSWPIYDKTIDDAEDISFVTDPFPSGASDSKSPVLRVTYGKGSYSEGGGGAQFTALWNPSGNEKFQSMLVTYEVAFDIDFDWVKGGKLPGIRGGPKENGCSGGNAADGSNCFTSRVMWRTDGAGEVYSYFLTPDKLCDNKNFECHSDGYGTSIDRGSFSFVAGQWNRVTMLVRLNNPLDTANGQVALYHNNVEAINQDILQYRNSDDVYISGFFFSTFFAGGDSSYATPTEVHSYFRNIEMWGSTKAA